MSGSWIDFAAPIGWTLLFIAFVLGLASDQLPELGAGLDRLVPAYGLALCALVGGVLPRGSRTPDPGSRIPGAKRHGS